MLVAQLDQALILIGNGNTNHFNPRADVIVLVHGNYDHLGLG